MHFELIWFTFYFFFFNLAVPRTNDSRKPICLRACNSQWDRNHQLCSFDSFIVRWNIKKYFWSLLQDSNGGIFSVSLNPSDPVQHVDRLYVCHPGKVIAIATSPVSHDLATLGEKGFLRIYNVMMKTLILQKQFCAGGTSLIWLPPYVRI